MVGLVAAVHHCARLASLLRAAPHAIANAMLEDRILFIDGEAIVIDKPAGLPVDPPRRGGDSIVSALDELRSGFKRPPVVMHRLDQDTSGCLLLARSSKA